MGTLSVQSPAQCEDAREAEDDLTLVHATKRGDASAFEKLVNKYDRKLLRIAQGVTHNREEAEDAVQEAFFKAYQRLDQFQENAKFSNLVDSHRAERSPPEVTKTAHGTGRIVRP